MKGKICFQVIRGLNLHVLVSIMFFLRILKLIQTISTLSVSMTMFVCLIGLILLILLVVKHTYYNKPWVIICLLQTIFFVTVQFPAFITFRNRLDDFFINSNYVSLCLSINALSYLINIGNKPIIFVFNLCCYVGVYFIALKGKDYWLGFNIFTEIVTIITIQIIRNIDGRTLYNQIVKVIINEIIKFMIIHCDKNTLHQLNEIVINAVSIEALVKNINSVVRYMNEPSDKTIVEYLEEIKKSLMLVQCWFTFLVPPTIIHYYMMTISQLKLTVIALIISSSCVSEYTFQIIVLCSICEIISFLLDTSPSSLDLLIVNRNNISDTIDSVIVSIDTVSSGVKMITITINTIDNGVKKVYDYSVETINDIGSYIINNPGKTIFSFGAVGIVTGSMYYFFKKSNSKKI